MGATISLHDWFKQRDGSHREFNRYVNEIKDVVGRSKTKAEGELLAHAWAHLAWTLTSTRPDLVDGFLKGNDRRNDAVKWLRTRDVISEPIPVQMATLVNALREAGAHEGPVNLMVSHY